MERNAASIRCRHTWFICFFITYISIKYSKQNYILPVSISILIVIQAIMGMLTVTMLVKPTVVTTHLFFGMLNRNLAVYQWIKIFWFKFISR